MREKGVVREDEECCGPAEEAEKMALPLYQLCQDPVILY